MKNRLIIVGASGVIGQALFQLAKRQAFEVVGTYKTHKISGLLKFDMRRDLLRAAIPDFKMGDTVFLLSAYSNPTWISRHQREAEMVNLVSTKKLIDEISAVRASLIFMSSVEVFDGKQGKYSEDAIPHPLTLYGRMKYEIEKYLAKKGGNKYCIVRSGWNICWNPRDRCVITLTYETLLKGGVVRMADDNIFSIIDVNDTAQGLIKLSQNRFLKICHLATAPALIRSDLAETISNFSINKNLNKFARVPFAKIKYTEKRGRLNDLDNSLAVSVLGLTFRPPEAIIEQKVDLLDNYYVGRNLQ